MNRNKSTQITRILDKVQNLKLVSKSSHRGISSIGRVPRSQRGGNGIETRILHF